MILIGHFPSGFPWAQDGRANVPLPGHEGVRPSEDELTSACNLGYAKRCSWLPAERHADAVRFALGEERDGILRVLFACEREHLPAGHGELLYDAANGSWLRSHDDARVQRMAECYVRAQKERRGSCDS